MGLTAYFGLVVDNVDEKGQGRISVLVSDIDPKAPIIAKPVFFPIGGWEGIEDSNAHRGSYLVPPVGSVVVVLLSHKNNTEAYYIGTIQPYDNKDKPSLPESGLPEPHKRVVLARTESGQSIILSEANVDKGVRITGFKNQYDRNNPSQSVLKKKDNQSMIEIDGKTGNVHIYSINDIILETDGGYIKITKDGELQIRMKKSYTLDVPKTTENTSATRRSCLCQGHSKSSTNAEVATYCIRCRR